VPKIQNFVLLIFVHPRKTYQIKDLMFYGTTTAPPRNIFSKCLSIPLISSLFQRVPKIQNFVLLIFVHPRKTYQIKDLMFYGTTTAPCLTSGRHPAIYFNML